MKMTFVRRAVTAGTVLVLGATAAVGAYATVLDPVATRQGSLTSFGPLMDNGFPTSYKDSKAVRLEACYTATDPLCPAAGIPDPAAPVVFPTNFPVEFFYQLASATLPVNPAAPTEKLLVETNLEASFANGTAIPGDQITFARIRIKDVDVPAGTTWKITHPYGVDEFTAGANGKPGINVTQDVGVSPGSFGGALNSRLGPFLKWDPAVLPLAPVGYIGNPGVLHQVTGSPYGTNYIKVEQLNANGSWTTLVSNYNQFTLQGRYAVNSGVTVDAANFTTDASGNSFVDVYASSDAGQAIQVSASTALGTPIVPMREQDGRYYAHIAVPPVIGKVPPGTTIDVVNVGDKPPTTKTVPLADQVIVTSATYNADTQALTVTATSSDAETGLGLAPVLTMADPMGSATPVTLVNGTVTFPLATVPPAAPGAPGVTAPPATVKVTSSRGGSDTSQLTASGAGFTPVVPVANFTLPAIVQAGQPVPLDGTASTGGVTNYTWTTTNGIVTPSSSSLGLATWTPATPTPAPAAPATVTLTVVAPGAPGGVSLTRSVVVTAAGGVVANAGPNQTKTRGQVVTLDASATTGQKSIAWSQVSGPPVTLTSTTALKPTFTYPLMKLPVGPAGHVNTGYAVANAPIVLRVTATASTGTATSTATVTISPTPETLTPQTTRYRTRGDWRVTGTTNIISGQVVAMVLGNKPTGAYIGQATVDAAGAFSFKGGAVPVASGSTVTYISSTGGTAVGTLLITP
jgi:hypothetical protein